MECTQDVLCIILKWHWHFCSPTALYSMMTSSKGNIFRVTGPLCGEFTQFPAQRPVTRGFDDFFDREAGDLRRQRVHYDVIVMNRSHRWTDWYCYMYMSVQCHRSIISTCEDFVPSDSKLNKNTLLEADSQHLVWSYVTQVPYRSTQLQSSHFNGQ